MQYAEQLKHFKVTKLINRWSWHSDPGLSKSKTHASFHITDHPNGRKISHIWILRTLLVFHLVTLATITGSVFPSTVSRGFSLSILTLQPSSENYPTAWPGPFLGWKHVSVPMPAEQRKGSDWPLQEEEALLLGAGPILQWHWPCRVPLGVRLRLGPHQPGFCLLPLLYPISPHSYCFLPGALP